MIVEYLVAYKRVRTLCNCGHKLMERTVVKEGSENRGRKIYFCPNEEKKCHYSHMLPLCNCGRSASVKVSHSSGNPGRAYYGCYEKYRYRNKCDFFEWKEGGVTAPNKKARYS